MENEGKIIGIIGIIIGIAIFIKTKAWIPSLVPIILGIIMTRYCKEENKIEKKRDKK